MPLPPQSKRLNDGSVTLNVLALDVIEQSSALSDQHQKAPSGMVVFFVNFQVFGQIPDTVCEQPDLNLG
jgi:hypothetical protein